MRPLASPVEDQMSLGSCTANAVVGNYELLLNKDYPAQYIDLSRLFVYYNARLIDNSINEDSGAYIRDGVKSVKKYGVCSEKLWPYNINNFALTPSVDSYADAEKRNIKNYYRVSGVNDALDALSNNHPIVTGMLVYSEFDDLNTNNPVLTVPGKDSSPLGGHAVLLVGYDLSKQIILARNSFGTDWGIAGYFWMTFDYLKNEVMDMWIFDIELIATP